MPDSTSGHTHAGSANWSDTATVVSDSNTAVDRPGGTSGAANNNPTAESQTNNEPRYASTADGGPPNGGLTPGTYLDKRTNRIFTVGHPPLALPSHLRPPTSQTPFVRLHGFQELTPYPDPDSNSHSGSGSASSSQQASGSGTHHTGEMRLSPVGSNSTSTSASNPERSSPQGSGRA